jgi:DNA primase
MNHLPTIAIWQKRGMEFIAEAEAIMWSPDGQAALNYLHKRGLKDGTIKRYRLGFCPYDKYEQADVWGYALESSKVWLAKGITIPNINRETLWSINIRRPDSTPKYIKVKGSRNALFGANNLVGADVGLLCEGEFDCIIADQEIGDAIGVATLGGASQRLDLATWGPYLMRLQTIFVVYDSDSAGVRGAEDLAHLGNRLKRITLPDGNWKDINDYILAGGDLWAWLKDYIHLPSNWEESNLVEILTSLGGAITHSWDE